MPFSRPTLQELIQRAQADLEARLSGADARLRWNVERVCATVSAGAAHTLHGHLDWISKQVIPDTAEYEYLVRWANFFGVPPKPATPATGPLSITGLAGSVVPAGSVFQRSDGARFDTAADLDFGATGTLTATLNAEVPGAAGNTDESSQLALVTPIAGITPTAVVGTGGLVDGNDPESAASLLQRLLSRIQEPPRSGAPGDYVFWARSVAGVTRAWEFPRGLGLGTVLVYVVQDAADGSIITSDQLVADVQAYINSVAPSNATVTVVKPNLNALNPQVALTPSGSSTVEAAVSAALQALLLRQGSPGGTILLSQLRTAIGSAGGVTDYNLISPNANFVSPAGSLPVLGTPVWS